MCFIMFLALFWRFSGQFGGSHWEAEALDEPGRFAATVLQARVSLHAAVSRECTVYSQFMSVQYTVSTHTYILVFNDREVCDMCGDTRGLQLFTDVCFTEYRFPTWESLHILHMFHYFGESTWKRNGQCLELKARAHHLHEKHETPQRLWAPSKP